MVENNLPTNTEIDVNSLPVNRTDIQRSSRKPLFIFLSIGTLAALALGFIVFNILRGGSDNVTVAKVGNATITKKNVVEEYNLRYSTTPKKTFSEIDRKTQEELVDSMIQILILENEAKKLRVSVTEEELEDAVQQKILLGIPKSTLDSKAVVNDLKIALLKNKLKEKLVSFREIETASIFVPEGPDMELRFGSAKRLLGEFRDDVSAGKSFEQANELAKQKGYYNPGLTINKQRLIKKDLSLNFLGQAAFTLQKGAVSDVIDSRGGTLGIVFIHEAGDYDYNSLEEWLTAQKAKLVK